MSYTTIDTLTWHAIYEDMSQAEQQIVDDACDEVFNNVQIGGLCRGRR